MDQEFEYSIRKTGFLLMMLLFFYAVFFTNKDYSMPKQHPLTENKAVFLDEKMTQSSSEMNLKNRFLPEEVQKNLSSGRSVQYIEHFYGEAVQSMELIGRANSMSSVLMRGGVRIRGRLRIAVLILLIWIAAGLWKNDQASGYWRLTEGKSARIELCRNRKRRGPPAKACLE